MGMLCLTGCPFWVCKASLFRHVNSSWLDLMLHALARCQTLADDIIAYDIHCACYYLAKQLV
jgi:hypothetical protein